MSGRTGLRLARFEFRRAGLAAVATPPGVLAAGIVMLIVTDTSGGSYHHVAGTVLEALLPLAVGIATSSVLSADTATELQLSLPTPYRWTLARRVGLMLAGSAALSALFAVVITRTGLWRAPHGPWSAQLSWLAPAAALSGVSLLLAAASVNAGFAAAGVAVIWVGQQAYKPWFAAHSWTHRWYLFPDTRSGVVANADWAANRLTLLAVGLITLAATWLVLANTERLLHTRMSWRPSHAYAARSSKHTRPCETTSTRNEKGRN